MIFVVQNALIRRCTNTEPYTIHQGRIIQLKLSGSDFSLNLVAVRSGEAESLSARQDRLAAAFGSAAPPWSSVDLGDLSAVSPGGWQAQH